MGNGIPANAIALLQKAAADPGVAARMEKAANPFRFLMRNTLGRGVGTRAPGSSFLGGPRKFSLGRTATTGGVGVGGAALHSHLDQNASNTQGMNLNPYTWGRNAVGRKLGMGQGPSREQIFQGNQQGLDDVYGRSGLKGEMEAARSSGDTAKWMELNKRRMAGDFDVDHGWDADKILDGNMPDINPLNYRMGGLNPWAHTSAATSRGRMMGAQKGMQGDYNSAMQKVGPQPGDAEMMTELRERMESGDMLPDDATMYQQQMQALQSKMTGVPGQESPAAAAIKQRMISSGMRHTPWRPPAQPPAPPGPQRQPGPQPGAGNWGSIGRRPSGPGVKAWATNPYDWEPVIGGPANSPTQFGG